MRITKPPVQNESIWEWEYRIKQEAKEALVKAKKLESLKKVGLIYKYSKSEAT